MKAPGLFLVVLAGCGAPKSECADALKNFEGRLMERRALKKEPPMTPEEQQMAQRFFDGLKQRCTDDAWSKELIACVEKAATGPELETCQAQLPETQRKKLREMTPRLRASSQAQLTKVVLQKYATEAYPQWAMAHPDQACPDSLIELHEYLANPDRNDPWGNPYKMFCGPTLPTGAQGLGVLSFGPDGKEATSDDITSWQ